VSPVISTYGQITKPVHTPVELAAAVALFGHHHLFKPFRFLRNLFFLLIRMNIATQVDRVQRHAQ
jgi:hypothetical protein